MLTAREVKAALVEARNRKRFPRRHCNGSSDLLEKYGPRDGRGGREPERAIEAPAAFRLYLLIDRWAEWCLGFGAHGSAHGVDDAYERGTRMRAALENVGEWRYPRDLVKLALDLWRKSRDLAGGGMREAWRACSHAARVGARNPDNADELARWIDRAAYEAA